MGTLSLGVLAAYIVHMLGFSKPTTYNFHGSDGEFLPEDLLSLRKGSAGVANAAGDLLMMPFSRYNLTEAQDQTYVRISSLADSSLFIDVPHSENQEYFWLDSRTLASVTAIVTDDSTESWYRHDLHVVPLHLELSTAGSTGILRTPGPQFVGPLAEYSANEPRFYRYVPESRVLVYYDEVLEGNKTERQACDHTSFMGSPSTGNGESPSSLFSSHYTIPTIFAVNLSQNAHAEWVLASEPRHLVDIHAHSPEALEYVRRSTDFDVSKDYILYRVSPLPQPCQVSGKCAYHYSSILYLGTIAQNVKPKALTGHKVFPDLAVLNRQGSKAAWVEMPAERKGDSRTAKIMVYDIKTDATITVLDALNDYPQELTFSPEGDTIYFIAGEKTRVAMYRLSANGPLPSDGPQTPLGTDRFESVFSSTSISGLQFLSDGRMLFTRFSHLTPNEVFAAHGPGYADSYQVTRLNSDVLAGKQMIDAERFYFTGADNTTHQGWLMKPKGWAQGKKAKWPAVLILTHDPSGAWPEQWTTLWNPNIFAQQGFFCILVDIAPGSLSPLGPNSDPKPMSTLHNVRNGWKHITQSFPEIAGNKAILLGTTYFAGIISLRNGGDAVKTMHRDGLNFVRTETPWDEDFSPWYDNLSMQDILRRYDFLTAAV
ncbi:hypothetical protein HGRIS_005737 [Hohenbuehelia grisea]|uniref:Dipeptidylpeptidase IV N-terminal domain-containing protein n=1 Tax=Hohenbuehelia grisea TaxID=104357 RepID=A0ABR3JYN6_9AGAR